MKILVVQPIELGHRDFDDFMVRCLEGLGCVTLASPKQHLSGSVHCRRISLPEIRGKSRLRVLVDSIRAMRIVRRAVIGARYDAVVFLAYETVSFALCWPKREVAFLFEHNNLERARTSIIARWLYRRLGDDVVHFVFQRHISECISRESGRRAIPIPHPYYADEGTLRLPRLARRRAWRKGALVIFSPSSSTPSSVQAELREVAEESGGKYFVLCKGSIEQLRESWEVKRFFEDYEQHMMECDAVFFGARFEYRVSGVVHEALSFGKCVIMLDCGFARVLQQQYPTLVRIVKEVRDILAEDFSMSGDIDEQRRFLTECSAERISSCLRRALVGVGQ